MKKGLLSLMAVVVCAFMLVTSVLASYPVSKNTYQLTTSSATSDLTDVETVVWRSEDTTKDFGYSPAICITKTGRIIVTYDVSANYGVIAYSDDGGKNFTKASMQDDKFIFARPFETESGLYVIARKKSDDTSLNGDLIIFKSVDNGSSWGEASTLSEDVWHSAPTEIWHVNGFVYMTWEVQDITTTSIVGGAGRATLAPVVLRAKETDDLTQKSNWTFSDSTLSYYDAVNGNIFDNVDYMGVPFNHDRYDAGNGETSIQNIGWLEGNLVRITDPTNELYDEKAFYIYLRSTANTSDYANLMKVVENDDGSMTASVVTTPSGKTQLYVQLPGGQSKFYITYDDEDKIYWLVSNISADSMALDTTMGTGSETNKHEGPQDVRNELGLFYSSNAMNWNFAGYVSRTDEVGQARSYASMVIDGEDLLVVSRSGDENAQSAHNNNLITLHRIRNFRTLVNEAKISNEDTMLVYSPSLLTDSSVKDINIFVTDDETKLVTLSISDETGTEGKILIENADGMYEEKLSTTYKLGEPFAVEGTTYIFGVADHKLVVFTSVNNGTGWSGPYTIDTTRDWYEAPTSALIKDDTIMLALSEITHGIYKPIRGYSGSAGSLTLNSEKDSAVLTGYGAVGYTEAFDLAEGESVSITISPKTLQAGTSNKFFVVFSDMMGSFFGNSADAGNGVAFELRSFGNYTSGANVWYEKVSNGAIDLSDTGINLKNDLSSGNVSGDMSANTYTVKLTRTASEGYSWIMTMSTSANSYEYTYQIPVTDLATDAFANGCYISVANVAPQNVENSYEVTNPVISSVPENTDETTEAQWEKYTGNANYTGTVTTNGTEVTMSGRSAAYYNKAIPVAEGTKISFDVTFPIIVSGTNIQYGFALTTDANAFYLADVTATSASVGNQLVGTTSTKKINSQGEIRLVSGNRKVLVSAQTVTADWTMASSKTYNVTYIKQATTSDYSWVITVKDDTSIVTMNILASEFAHNMFDESGAYIVAGSATGNAHSMNVSNLTVIQPGDEEATSWSALRGYTGTAGNIVSDNNGAILSGYGAVTYNKKFDVSVGESVSVSFKPETLDSTTNNTFGIAFLDAANSFYAGTADSGNGIAFQLYSNANYTTGGVGQYAKISGGSTSVTTSNILNTTTKTSPVYGDNTDKDISKYMYTVSLTHTADNEYPWILTMTNTATSYVFEKKIPASDLAADAFKNGLSISVGNRAPQKDSVIYKINDPICEKHIATTSVRDAYMVSPVIMAASVSATLTESDSWTYYKNGESFANKIGNAYSNSRFNYFGLPYYKDGIDIRTIGWSDLKLFELYDDDDIRYDVETGNVYGYMTLMNAGYNYAAFVKVNTNTGAIEFFTPTSQSEGITEEEMVFSKMPGGNHGFEILYDSTTKLYWLVTTENMDSVCKANESESKIVLYYSANAYDWKYGGTVDWISGDARVSAAIEEDNLIITAINHDVENYTIQNFRELSGVSGMNDWSVIRGYNSATNGALTVASNKVVLDSYGGATCNTKIDVAENTEISFVLKGTDLSASGSYFSVGLIDTKGNFFGGAGETGNGFVVTIMPWSSLGGAAIRYSAIVSGKAGTELASGALVGGSQITSSMINNEITVKFIKRTQTIDGNNYSWYIEITEANAGNTRTYNIPMTDVSDTLFTNGAYLIAGGSNAKDVTYEISDITVTIPVVGDVNADGEINILDIVSVDYAVRDSDSYKPYEKVVYDADENGTIEFKDVSLLREKVLSY